MRSAQILLTVSLLGCAPTDVVVATQNAGRGCESTDDCHEGDFCARDTCGGVGHCERKPFDCPATTDLTCGCDGITYWNDCLRKLQGVTAASEGYCTQDVLPCTGPGTCPPKVSCARLFPSCTSDGTGACVMLPYACPPPPGGERYGQCGDPTSCVDACTAIRTEQPHQVLSACH
jgi:hypothetical protein